MNYPSDGWRHGASGPFPIHCGSFVRKAPHEITKAFHTCFDHIRVGALRFLNRASRSSATLVRFLDEALGIRWCGIEAFEDLSMEDGITCRSILVQIRIHPS